MSMTARVSKLSGEFVYHIVQYIAVTDSRSGSTPFKTIIVKHF